MECCICYKKKGIYITKCSHNLCLDCLIQLRKIKCPYCRGELDLPNKIKNIINNNSTPNNGTPYTFNGIEQLNIPVSQSIMNSLNSIRTLSLHHYNQMIRSINSGMHYDESYLREFYDDLYRENRNLERITGTYWVEPEMQ